MSNPNVAATDPVGPASAEEARIERGARLPDVIRVMAGLAANAQIKIVFDDPDVLAATALRYVQACERACGIGGDE